MSPQPWTPPEADKQAWAPPTADRPTPKAVTGHGDRLKGTPTGLPDTFMGTMAKDFASVPEGLYDTVAHPIDTVKGAFQQLLNLPGDIVTDISKGNWGKLAVKLGEVAVPALNTERGAAAAGIAGAATKDAIGAVANKAAEVAANPVARELVGVVSPRAKNALAAYNRVKTAAEAAAAEDAAPAAAVAETPGMALAKESDQDWAKLSADDRGILEQVAKAKANAAAQPARPPMGPPPEAPPVAPEPVAPPTSTSLADMLRAEVDARKAAETPAPASVEPGPPVTKPRRNAPPAKLPPGAQRVPTPLGTTGTPLGTMPPPRAPQTLGEMVQEPASPVVAAPPEPTQVAPAVQPEPVTASQAPPPPAPTSRTVEVPTRGEVPGTVKWMTEDGLEQYVNEHGMKPDEARAALTANGYEIVSRGKLNRAIHGAGNQLGLGHDAVSDIAAMDYGVKSMTQLSQDQLLEMYERIQDRQALKAPAAPKSAPAAAALDGMSVPELRKALELPANASPAEVRAAKVKAIGQQLKDSLEGK